jgi:hypothetical protein
MLDVHPPHEAIHTWKAFLIHIVAIVIGLLIAVGLEQTVEFFHRLGIFAAEGQAILDGARDENDLVKSLRASPDANPGAEAAHK